MAASKSERKLRRMTIRLKSLCSADYDAVIADLDEGQRRKILSLLEDLEPVESETSFVPNGIEVVIPKGISFWLAARINGKGESGEETTDVFEMTGYAHARLRHCAAAMVPSIKAGQQSPSLFAWLGRAWS